RVRDGLATRQLHTGWTWRRPRSPGLPDRPDLPLLLCSQPDSRLSLSDVGSQRKSPGPTMSADQPSRCGNEVVQHPTVTEEEQKILLRAVTALRIQAARHDWAEVHERAEERRHDADVLEAMAARVRPETPIASQRIVHLRTTRPRACTSERTITLLP